MHHSQLTVVLAAIMMLSLLWGSSFIAIKIIVDEVQPLASFGMRFFIAGLLLVATHYVFLHTIYRRSSKKDYQGSQFKSGQLWKHWVLSGLFFIVGGQGLLALGAQYLSSGAAALINSTIPIWVAIFMLLFFRKKPTRLSIAGIIAGFIGLIILVLPTLETEESSWVGVVLLIVSSISWAIGSLFSSPVRAVGGGAEQAILLPTGMFMALGGLILLALWAVTGTGRISTLNILFSTANNVLLSFLFLTLVCTAVGYAIFYWLLGSTTPSLANTFAYIVPVIAVFLGWVILGESINSQTIIATVVISAGVAMMIVSPAPKKTN
ncbi:MAG TPA: EamA family transporter [Nitrososphaeraceae archaeon]|nr:EamA family transporter [Nitrososphaeraceae archaeon]